eukprot:9761802-Karenia_brevis.AAC.1
MTPGHASPLLCDAIAKADNGFDVLFDALSSRLEGFKSQNNEAIIDQLEGFSAQDGLQCAAP